MPEFKTIPVVVLAERFDGSVELAERYQLRYVERRPAETVGASSDRAERVRGEWFGPGAVKVGIGDWLVTRPDSLQPPQPIPEGEFIATYELAGQDREDARDLALRVAGDRIRELEHELAQMRDQAKRAREELRAATVATEQPPTPPPTKPTMDEWYSCAVCSHKTNEFPSAQVCHACCLGTARVGPCCAKAVQKSPQVVGQVLTASNHRPDCNRPQ